LVEPVVVEPVVEVTQSAVRHRLPVSQAMLIPEVAEVEGFTEQTVVPA
jgi:hypothetical protein